MLSRELLVVLVRALQFVLQLTQLSGRFAGRNPVSLVGKLL